MRRNTVFTCLIAMAVLLSFPVLGVTKGKEKLVADKPSPGALNAIKRAYQMVNLRFTPQVGFGGNQAKVYEAGKEYRGLVYSSVKELHTYVGMDVSFHTFMTAMHNPRSVIYTIDVSKPPYHGRNSAAYYGTVCTGLTTYAFDLNVYKRCLDFKTTDFYELVEEPSSLTVRLADVILSSNHAQLITGIKRDPQTGKAVEIEICEAVHSGCRKATLSGKKLDQKISQGRKLYRYKYLDDVTYEPLTDFVALDGEELTPFKYNDDICTSRGDKACYIVGDTVVVNTFGSYRTLEIYKDSVLYKEQRIKKDEDVVLTDLPYGDYRARLVQGNRKSDYTYWKVIDVHVDVDENNKTVTFHSANARPVYLDFASESGGRPPKGVFEFTEEDIAAESKDVSSYNIPKKNLKEGIYVRVHFECDYGRVMNRPIKWGK